MDIFKNLIKVISKQTKKFMSEDMGLIIKDRDIKVRKLDKPILKGVGAFITLNELKLSILISYDELLSEYLMDKFSFEDLSNLNQEEIEIYKKEVACEIVNTVVGNAIMSLPKKLQTITISTPYYIKKEFNHDCQYSVSTLIDTNRSEFSINYIKE